MTNYIPEEIATPYIETKPDSITLGSYTTLTLEPWFTSSRINPEINNVTSYKFTKSVSSGFIFSLGFSEPIPNNTGFYVSLLCNNDVVLDNVINIKIFDSNNSNLKVFYCFNNTSGYINSITFSGEIGIYNVNFLNVSLDTPLFLNDTWEEYECQNISINGLPLNQLGFQTSTWFNYSIGFSQPDRTAVSRGHATSEGGYDITYINIPLRLDFNNLAAASYADNHYEAAVNMVETLIDFLRDTNLYVTYKQKRDEYHYCLFNSVIDMQHNFNTFDFTLVLQKINNKGTTSFSVKPSSNKFKSLEFIIRMSQNQTLYLNDKVNSNYVYIKNNSQANTLIETMYFNNNNENLFLIKNGKHFKTDNYNFNYTPEKIIYLN